METNQEKLPVVNIVKIREDYIPLYLEKSPKDSTLSFDAQDQSLPSWISSGNESIHLSDLRKGIEPWLTALFQSEHLSLLTGAGLSTAIQVLSGEKPISAMQVPSSFLQYDNQIKAAAQKNASANNRGEANIEDHLRIISDLLRGLEIMEQTPDFAVLNTEFERIIKNFANDICKIENSIAKSTTNNEAFNYLVSFLMSFASRTGTRDRLNIFTTNYDRIIEAGAELAGLHLVDRFVGNLSPIFRSSRLDIDLHYSPPGIRGEPRYLEGVARFTKLHGSLDWIDTGSEIRRIGLPFGALDITPYLEVANLDKIPNSKLLIYPNSSKDRETAEYPYVELFRDCAASICRPNSTLVTYGYGFGDEHINRIIRDMLTIPSTHLVIISYDDAGGRIMENYKKIGRPSQVSLIIGPDLANMKTLVDFLLPKPSIDKASLRMSELIKQRYISPDKDNTTL